MDIKAIVFDFDGVIVESVGIKDQAFQILFRDYPQHIDEIMSYHRTHNATIRFEKFRYITEKILKTEYAEGKEEELKEKFSRFVFEKICACPLVKGAQEFLDYFYRKTPMFLASVNPAEELDKILDVRGLTKYFKKVYPYPRMKKEAIEEILRQEKISSRQTVFIGDSYEDYEAAQATGILFVGRERHRTFEAIDVPSFKDLKEIRKFLLVGLSRASV